MMLQIVSFTMLLLVSAAESPAALTPELSQAPPQEPARPAAVRPAGPPPVASQTPPPPQVPTVQRSVRGRDVNVQIEITITDQAGSGTPEKKVVSMLIADATMGRVRASADARIVSDTPGGRNDLGMVGIGLNVDARPSVLENDRILLELTIEYKPFREGGTVMQRPTELNESVSVILPNGKPVVVSQAADPVTDRKMTVEVRATIVK